MILKISVVHVLATCSQDNSCKIWDLRKRNIEYTIPAHTKGCNVTYTGIWYKYQGLLTFNVCFRLFVRHFKTKKK